MSWRPVTDLLDRSEWYSAMYSLVAHRAHRRFENADELSRAQREAVLLALACAATIRRRTRNPLAWMSNGYRWPSELDDLDQALFRNPDRVLPPIPATESARIPRRYRIRRRGNAERRFTRFLERTVEPSALILLAAIGRGNGSPEAPRRWSRRELVKVLALAAESGVMPDRHRLIETAVATKGIDGRAYYNLACYYAQDGEIAKARDYLRAAVFAASGPTRQSRVVAALNDPTLAPAVQGWDDPEGVLRVPKRAAPPGDPPALERIEAIGGYAEKLAALDIKTPETLAEQLRSAASQRDLAEHLEAELWLLRDWQDLLRLLEIDGVGPAQLNLLAAAGITSPEVLRRIDLHTLHRRLVLTNTARNLVRAVPSEATLVEWRAEARRLRE